MKALAKLVPPILALLLMPTLWAQYPQVPVTGNIGAGGVFPLINSPSVVFASDADHTMVYPEMSGSSGVLAVTSSTTLSTQRNLIVPTGKYNWIVENLTTGGKAIYVEESTGAGVQILNGYAQVVGCDATHCFTPPAGSGGTVLSVTGTAPISCTSGANPLCSMAQANSTTNGWLDYPTYNYFAAKQAALGFAPAHSGANSDILSLSGLTTPLSTGQGGTGGAGGTGYAYDNGSSPFSYSTTIPFSSITGLVPNAQLLNPSTTVNGQTCTLGGSCSITASAGAITIGSTTIIGGTDGDIEYNNSGTLGEKGVTGTGSVVLAASPSIASPTVTGAFTANGLVTNADLTYSTISGVSLGSNLPSLTFNNGGSGAVSGSAYNGSNALSVSYNTVGASPLAGSTSLTTLGTVTTGTWQGDTIASTYGGTGGYGTGYRYGNGASPDTYSTTIPCSSISGGGDCLGVGTLTAYSVTLTATEVGGTATATCMTSINNMSCSSIAGNVSIVGTVPFTDGGTLIVTPSTPYSANTFCSVNLIPYLNAIPAGTLYIPNIGGFSAGALGIVWNTSLTTVYFSYSCQLNGPVYVPPLY